MTQRRATCSARVKPVISPRKFQIDSRVRLAPSAVLDRLQFGELIHSPFDHDHDGGDSGHNDRVVRTPPSLSRQRCPAYPGPSFLALAGAAPKSLPTSALLDLSPSSSLSPAPFSTSSSPSSFTHSGARSRLQSQSPSGSVLSIRGAARVSLSFGVSFPVILPPRPSLRSWVSLGLSRCG